MRSLAKQLPIPEKRESYEMDLPYGNNFYALFSALLKKKKGEKLTSFFQNFFPKIEACSPERWRNFIEGNTDLLTQIEEVLKQKDIYDELMDYFRTLVQNNKTTKLGDSIDEEINIDGIQYDIWNKLNPLLKQASEAMAVCGINPKDFYS